MHVIKQATLRNYPLNFDVLHWNNSSGVSDTLQAFNFVLRYNNTTTSNTVVSVGGCYLHNINTGITVNLKKSLGRFRKILVIKFPSIYNISSLVWFNADKKEIPGLDGMIRKA